jgi:hypothetical protein
MLIRVVNCETRAFGGSTDFAADTIVNAAADRLAIDSAHVAVNNLR